MQLRYSLITIILLATFSFEGCVSDNNFPILEGSYLGQKPPGMIPEIFAPGIISSDANEGCSSFSQDGRLYLFARSGSKVNGILLMHQIDGIWSQPTLAPFSAGKYDWDFMLAPDSKTVFISSGRPISKNGSPEKEYRIWVSEKLKEGWKEPIVLPFPVNSGQHDSHPSLTKKKTLYFFSNRNSGLGEGDIYKSEKDGDEYKKIENIGLPVNTKYHEVDPFIAPDESYIIFCSQKPGGFGDADIYISFLDKDGCWTIPINLGEKINSDGAEYIPYITPDSKYFFFTSNKSGSRNIYWVDSKLVLNLIKK